MNIQTFIQTTIAITNVLPSGTAFGVTAHGENVFIPIGVANKSNATIGDEVSAKLVKNSSTAFRDRTPYMAIFIEPPHQDQPAPVTPTAVEPEPELTPEPAPEAKPKPTVEEVYSIIEDGYMTTAEVAEWLDLDVTPASNLMNEFHNQGKVAKAYVFSKADHKRASVVLWARDVSGFVGGEE